LGFIAIFILIYFSGWGLIPEMNHHKRQGVKSEPPGKRSRRIVSAVESRNREIASRLRAAREALGHTQTQFADQISITRERLATYEDGRVALRCDAALRACRHFFISEFWLAFGCVSEEKFAANDRADFSDSDARLTMALAVEPIALGSKLGASFAAGFDPFLRQEYLRLAKLQDGFPRIIPLDSDGPEYLENALNCALKFWTRGLSNMQRTSLYLFFLGTGASIRRQVQQPENPIVLGPQQFARGSIGKLPGQETKT
jgi:transcriptional regulator with XRE-family HTH domain